MYDQAEELRRMRRLNKQTRRAKTISVASGKGGVGKSNISLNMALDLIHRNNKVLLFDLDVGMGNIDVLLGLNTAYSVVDLFERSLSIYDMIATGPDGLACIMGGSGLDHLFVADDRKRERFYDAYSKLIYKYDYIIMDMGAGATEDSLLFMLASDECFIIATPEPTAIMDAYSMVKHLVFEGFTNPVYVLMNRVPNQRQGLRSLKHFTDVVQQFLHRDVRQLGTLPEDKLVSESVMKQEPFLIMNPKAPISRALKRVVHSYLNDSQETKSSNRTSFIDKLKQLVTDR